MLEFYVNKNGELMSSKDKDIVVQTSKGVDTILVHLPEDYNDNNIVASITFKNPKNVKSNQYVMQHVDGSKQLSYLLDDAWFSYVKGTMEFTIRIYSTDTTMKDFVEIDDSTGDIIADEQSKKQVFTKGSYVILEAVEVGSTPEIPEDELEKLFNEITKRTTQAEVYAYVEKVTGINQASVEDKENPYVNIDTRLSIVEQDLQDESDIEEIAQKIYDSNDKVVSIEESENPLEIEVNNSSSSKNVSIKLPNNVVKSKYTEVTTTPVVEVTHSESSEYAIKSLKDDEDNVIHETYRKKGNVEISSSEKIVAKINDNETSDIIDWNKTNDGIRLLIGDSMSSNKTFETWVRGNILSTTISDLGSPSSQFDTIWANNIGLIGRQNTAIPISNLALKDEVLTQINTIKNKAIGCIIAIKTESVTTSAYIIGSYGQYMVYVDNYLEEDDYSEYQGFLKISWTPNGVTLDQAKSEPIAVDVSISFVKTLLISDL